MTPKWKEGLQSTFNIQLKFDVIVKENRAIILKRYLQIKKIPFIISKILKEKLSYCCYLFFIVTALNSTLDRLRGKHNLNWLTQFQLMAGSH